MVVYYDDGPDTDRIFRALSNGTRRSILSRVMGQDVCISAIAKRYPTSFAAVQKHVAVLESAGLVDKHARGREQIVRGNPDTVAAARDLLGDIEESWRTRLDSSKEVLKDG